VAEPSTPLKSILGSTAAKLKTSRGIVDVADFLAFLPRRYVDPATTTDLSVLHEDEYTAVVATVKKATTHPMRQRRGNMLNVVVADNSGHQMTLTFFKPFGHVDRLLPGRTGLFAGKIQRFKGTWQLAHPNYELFDEEDADDAMETYAGGLLPIYLEVPKLDSWNITKAARLVFHQLDDLPEPVPEELRSRHHLVSLLDAYKLVHLPRTRADVKRGLDRLLFRSQHTGSHEAAPPGFLLAYGTNVAYGQFRPGAIVDLTPTVLYYMGLHVGRDMDGFPRTDLFTREFPAVPLLSNFVVWTHLSASALLQQHYRLHRNRFAAPDGIHSLSGLRLQAHAANFDIQNFCEVFSHSVDVRAQLRPFEHQIGIDVFNCEPTLMRQPNDARKQLHAVGILPLRIGIRKMDAKVTLAQGAKNRVSDRMRQSITV